MIDTGLYPDYYTPIPEIKLTDTIANLQIEYPDGFPDAYYMGWVSWENLTNAAHVSTYDVTGTAGLKFTDITPEQNANIGYLVNYPTTIQDATNNRALLPISNHNNYYGVGNKASVPNVNDNYDFTFINKMSVQKVIPLTNDVRIYFYVSALNPSQGYPAWEGNYYQNVSVEALLNFFAGTGAININDQGLVESIYLNDRNANNMWPHNFSGVTGYISIIGIAWRCDAPSGNNNYSRIYPFTYVDTNAGRFYTVFDWLPMQYIQYVPNTGITDWIAAFDSVDNQLYLRGKWEGEITTDQFNAMGNRGAIYNGNCIFMKYNNTILVFNIPDPAELYKFFTLHMRMWSLGTGEIPDFGDTIYYPHISPENEYLCEWLNGDFSEIENDLRQWQYGDISDNEYNPEDLPPYEPPRDENENTGDKITRPATLGAGGTLGFITQYALRAADLTELGGLLWTSIFTADYWKNYLFSLAVDTGSLDLASILNFFISLRVYPFPLVNVPSYAAFGNNMYIGTGLKPLTFANNLHTINNYCDYVPGGSATIWNRGGKATFFGDWRDYTNTEITLYIPYCGTVQLNPGDVVGNTISVQYAVDFATGGCIAYVDLETGDGAGFPIAALPGQMGADIPLTATAAGQVAARLAGDAMNVAGLIGGQIQNEIGVATGALRGNIAPSPASVGTLAGGLSGGLIGSAGGFAAGFGASIAPGLAGQAINMLGRGAVSAPMMGGARGFASFGAPQTPYVQIRRGIYPDFAADIMGNATAGVYTVGNLSGFVSGEIKTDSLTCSDAEKTIIKNLISRGIYV